MDTWKATHSRPLLANAQSQPKNASALTPIVNLDLSPALTTPESGPFSPNDTSVSVASSAELDTASNTPAQGVILAPAGLQGSPIHLRVSISVDPEQHYQKLIKAKVHVILVLTALLRLPDHETWVEQSRTELMSLEKGCLEGRFVKTLPIIIKENFLMVGFTLLVVPPSNTNPRVIAAFPTLDGLIPWAETSVAIEHLALDPSAEAADNDHPQPRSSSFTTPLMEASVLTDVGLRKSKQTIAALSVIVEEAMPRMPLHKAIAENYRTGHSFSQTYHGRTVRGTMVYGREHLYESPLAFTLPFKLLQFLAEDERRVLQELEREPGVSLSDLIQAVPLDHKPSPMTRGSSFMDTLRRSARRTNSATEEDFLKSTRARQTGLSEEDLQLQKLLRQQISTHRNIEIHYREMAQKLEQKLRENMETGQGPFRRSPEKKEEAVQWIPLNCCVQDFLVYDDGHQTNYQSTTVGAAAAHGAGFSHWANPQMLGNAPSLGAYWSKQERGSDLMRDLKALQDILNSCYSEFSSLSESTEPVDKTRAVELIKEIQFLNSEIVTFGDLLLSDYLTPSSREGDAHFICGEIGSLVERLRQVDMAGDDLQDQNQAQDHLMTRLTDYKRSIRGIVSCTHDLSCFVAIAIQHECLVADATLVATPEWIVEKKTRECCLSQIITALATSFLALLEDWWTHMAVALQEQKIIEQRQQDQRQQDQHHPECQHFLSRDMGIIIEESTGVSSGCHDVKKETRETLIAGTSKRSRCSNRRNGKGSAVRRPPFKSTLSCASSSSSSSTPGGPECDLRSRSSSRHPLEDVPQARLQNSLFWDQLMNLGWLVQIGSLLSTQGNELGMLLDYTQAALDAQESVKICFHALPQSTAVLPSPEDITLPSSATTQSDPDDLEDDSVQISGHRGQITVSFGLNPLQFSLLPDQLKAGMSRIHVWPVLFSQGINEMQAISDLTGKSPIQRTINEDGLRQMQSYALRHHTWRTQSQIVRSIYENSLDNKTTGRHSLGPHANWSRSSIHRSSPSLMSDIGSDWDVVSSSKAELWDGEPSVAELLRHLEMAVLGHYDETNDIFESSTTQTPQTVNLHESNSSSGPQSSMPRDENAHGSIGGPTTGILGSMMEYGTLKLFSFKGSKDTSILECAEALTRALGQIKAPLVTKSQESQEDRRSPQKDSESCGCLPRSSTPPITLSFSSLWVTSHIASCKSAKDRTSMSVTLSQVNLLRACHGLQTGLEQNGEDDWQAILDAMRSEIGVRIKNVERNLKLGDFAKDLLWLSAFGLEMPQQLPPIFGMSYQGSIYAPDAITLVRSLLPRGLQLNMGDQAAAGSGVTVDEPLPSTASVNCLEDVRLGFIDPRLLGPRNSPSCTSYNRHLIEDHIRRPRVSPHSEGQWTLML
ncbi:Inositol polyphosphate 4-phosphatase type II [Modicella reniformis]|uniref:Inositol polyphosphate 4-phosphatase type II n=1 Tax=Modicella reniformis TaxID=1440133 RepID=A0A9P6IPC6_9FUNG|nr:Inositol polyphosphate 4-phosphatase type II [Modicella reniformis]